MTIIQLTADEYEGLLRWAQLGASEAGATTEFLALRSRTDLKNEVRRYTLVIRYKPLPESFTRDSLYKPNGSVKVLELLRPPTKEDVLEAVHAEHVHESMIFVTRDPNGEVGWYDLTHFPWA